MNENFKNSLKGFKVKGIFITLAAIIIIALAANAFNSGTGFYIFCGVVALLGLVAYVIVAIRNNKKENETVNEALKCVEKAEAEKVAAKKAFEKQIAQLEKERNDAEFQLAQEKAKANARAMAVKEPVEQPKQAAPQSKAKKNNKK